METLWQSNMGKILQEPTGKWLNGFQRSHYSMGTASELGHPPKAHQNCRTVHPDGELFINIVVQMMEIAGVLVPKSPNPKTSPNQKQWFLFHDSFRFVPFNSKNLVKGISPCRSWVKYCGDRVCSCPSRKALSDTALWGRIETCENPTKCIKIPLFGRWPSSFPSYLYHFISIDAILRWRPGDPTDFDSSSSWRTLVW